MQGTSIRSLFQKKMCLSLQISVPRDAQVVLSFLYEKSASDHGKDSAQLCTDQINCLIQKKNSEIRRFVLHPS